MFPMSTNANEHVPLALDSDHTGKDDVEINQGGDQFVCSCGFICVIITRLTFIECCIACCKFILRCRLRELVLLTCLCEL